MSASRNTVIMAAGTLISRITGVARLIVLLGVLGLTGEGLPDAYGLANAIPTILYELLVGGILSATLIPVFVQRFAKHDEAKAWEGISAVFTVTAVVLLALSAAVLIGAPWIIDLYSVFDDKPLSAEQDAVSVYLLRLFVPQILLYGFISLATGLLHSRSRFGPPMFAPILNNIVLICVFLALASITDDLSLTGVRENNSALLILGLGTTAGVAAMALVLAPFFVRAGGTKLTWQLRPGHETVRTVVRLSGWTAALVVSNQLSLSLILMLAKAETGVNAYLIAYQFFILPHGILAVSIMTALQPGWADRWSRDDISGFKNGVMRGLRTVLFFMVPVAVGYTLLSEQIVAMLPRLLEWALAGEKTLSASEVELLGGMVFWLVVGLPGFSAFIFLTRAFQAMPDARTAFYLYVVENAVILITAYPLFRLMGLFGLTFSHSLSYAVGAVVALYALRRRVGHLGGRALASALLRMTVAATLLGLAVWFITRRWPGDSLPELVAAILAGTVVYLLCARLLRLQEMSFLLRRRAATE